MQLSWTVPRATRLDSVGTRGGVGGHNGSAGSLLLFLPTVQICLL